MKSLKKEGLWGGDMMYAEMYDNSGFFTLAFSDETAEKLYFSDKNKDKMYIDGNRAVADQIADLLVEISRSRLTGFTIEEPGPDRCIYIFQGKKRPNGKPPKKASG